MSTPLTNQSAFDTVVRHLHQQGHRAVRMVDVNSVCVYRAANGDKCAIGVLIPANLYRSEMEGLGITVLYLDKASLIGREIYKCDLGEIDEYPLQEELSNLFSLVDKRLLGELQTIHDYNNNWNSNGLNSYGIQALKAVADAFNLSTTVIKELFN